MYAYNFGSVNASRLDPDRALFRRIRLHRRDHYGLGGHLLGLIATEGLFSHLIESVFGISGNWLLLFGGVVLIVNLVAFPEGVTGNSYKKKQLRKSAGKTTFRGKAHRPTRASGGSGPLMPGQGPAR